MVALPKPCSVDDTDPQTSGASVCSLAISADGKILYTGNAKTVHLRTLAEPLDGSDEQIQCWIEVATGQKLVEHGVPQALGPADWHALREKLVALGGSPLAPRAGR
jgi:hypothetical protein